MEEFVRKHTESILKYKKGIFNQKQASNFVEKLIMRKEDEIEIELIKCLFPKNTNLQPNVREEREKYASSFLSEFKDLKAKLKESEDKKSKTSQKQNKIEPEWMPKMKINDENFPTLANMELMKRKKKFVVLDRHYKNKLEPGIKVCFCMSTRHPLVGNCTSCGRIHCLQEGDQVCIECGAPLVKKEEYLKQLQFDNEAQRANIHKDKLLKFQEEFYSKLQIIDDYSDWYEISNNTWLDEKSRQEARKKVEESIKDEIKV